MKEFDPECELHRTLLIVKAVDPVDPGCALELQIENCMTGKVTRLSTTESETVDEIMFVAAVKSAFMDAWSKFVH